MPKVTSARRARKSKPPRRRALPRSAKTALKIGLPLVMVAALGGAGLWFVVSGEGARIADNAKATALALSARAGLRVDNVLLSGRNRLSRASVERAVSIRRGMPIMAFDPQAAKTRLEKLTWIRSAMVERRLPDTIYIAINERRPLALWQFKRRLALIDEEGVIIIRSKLSPYRDLPLVVGEDAPRHAAKLIAILRSHRRLAAELHALVRVSNRRWNLNFKNGVIARLPEKGTARAVATLARLVHRERLLDRDVVMIDLRFADRLVVRTTARPDKKGNKGKPKRRPPSTRPSKDT